MIFLLFSETHLICAHGTLDGKKPLLTGIYREPLEGNLTDLFGYEEELNYILTSLLARINNMLPLAEERVLVSIPDSFVYHDISEADSGLSLPDVWDYLNWKYKKQWEDKYSAFSSFARVYEGDRFLVHSVHCDKKFIDAVNLSIRALAAFPVWMGCESTILKSQPKYHRKPILRDRVRGFDVMVATPNEISIGVLVNRKKTITLTSVKGNRNNLLQALNLDGIDKPEQNRKRTILLLDHPSEIKRKQLDSFRVTTPVPFKEVDLEGNVDSIPTRYKILLSNLVTSIAETLPLNFFLSSGIQDLPDAPPVSDQTTLSQKAKKKKKKRKPLNKKFYSDYWEKFQQAVITIIVLGLIAGLYALATYIRIEEERGNPLGESNHKLNNKSIHVS